MKIDNADFKDEHRCSKLDDKFDEWVFIFENNRGGWILSLDWKQFIKIDYCPFCGEKL